jgi:hypothetical protein
MFLPVKQIIFLSQSGQIRLLEPNNGVLEKMVFTAQAFSRLNFTRNQHEFIYRGNMYDVHTISKSGNQVVVLALWDKIESHMLLAFQNPGKSPGLAYPGATGVGFMPYFHVDAFRHDFHAPAICQIFTSAVQLNYSDPWFRIGSPPPELLAPLGHFG